MKRFNDDYSISDVMKEFMKTNKLESGLDIVNVKETWNKMMGPAIKNYTSAIELKKNTLYIQLSSSVVKQELEYGKSKIITMLNEELGKELIKEIVFR
ncbi:DUF721 domain-containing protein [Flavobacterium urocaniciphilum]|uniref:RNA-binding protein n=1 Tax=Flavobacterium urocaniciphilum TaxID=1299341 RepID=A0A1H9D7H2_9FLAO|nr:DUF721 domain-containing protein [Flavobacterium urocaniciphilum]SEQ09415.1 Protein of unknown function [Flavobacterium urocaniciphilum]